MASRNRSLTRLYQSLTRIPGNVASLEWNPESGSFKAIFRDAQPSAPRQEAPRQEPSFIKGTPFPDDDSALNPLDLVLHPVPDRVS